MAIKYKDKLYRSKKHPVLEYIFFKKNPTGDASQTIVSFTLQDISEGYAACGIKEPASTSNTILDLTRRKTTKEQRLPETIRLHGYDLRKRTGRSPDGGNYAGEFFYVGVGNEIESWLKWPEVVEEMILSSLLITDDIRWLLRNDEAALFSVMDYCDVLSRALYGTANSVLRVQHPMKWQPSEIDGLYFGFINGQKTLYPVEAKALATEDDVNLEQMKGGLDTMVSRFGNQDLYIIPLAVQMIENGIRIAIFKTCRTVAKENTLAFDRAVQVRFDPEIPGWKKNKVLKQLRKNYEIIQTALL